MKILNLHKKYQCEKNADTFFKRYEINNHFATQNNLRE